jgi:hypothetical protein
LHNATVKRATPVLHITNADATGAFYCSIQSTYARNSATCCRAVASVTSRKRAILGLAAMALSTVILLEHNLRFWHRAALVAEQVCDAAAHGKPVFVSADALPGIVSFGNGFKECVELKREK